MKSRAAKKDPITPSTRPFVINDPVHGYLVAAVHERAIVDHPITQRLRRINQTGLAEYVFPEARTSRFVHSLGAMHLASRFVLAALENADEKVAEHFFEDMQTRIPQFRGERASFEDLLQQDGTLSALSAVRSSFRFSKLRTNETKQLMAVVEAGLRLAALCHDLGHLPSSHDAEYALKDYAAQRHARGEPLAEPILNIADQEAPHEEIGHRLAKLVFHSLDESSPAVQASFEMATSILNVKSPDYDLRKRPQASALQWLHSLIDGEIDADRADYLLRDGRALGLDFAHYDVDRLVNNLVLIEDPDLGFVTAVKETGLPALESYCLSRYRTNQVFIRHHKVAQISAALRHALVKAFDSKAAKEFFAVLGNLGGQNLSDAADVVRRFGAFDDPWLFQMLKAVQQAGVDDFTATCLELVLDRGRTLRSLWKRKGDLTLEQFDKLNAKINDLLFASQSGPIRLVDKRRTLIEKGILIAPFKFTPYALREPTKQSVMLIQGKHRTESASKVSPLIRHLEDSWKNDLHVFAFVSRNSPLTLENVVEAILQD